MNAESLSYYLKENPKYYKDKHIIITGATGGIGSLLTSALLSLGAKVVAIMRDVKKLKSLFSKNIDTKQWISPWKRNISQNSRI